MPEGYARPRPPSRVAWQMTARPAGHPSLRAELAEAIGSLLDRTSHREVGRWIGRKGDTVTERGSSPDAWPVSELRVLADHDRDVEAALVAYLVGTQPAEGDAASATGDLFEGLAEACRLSAEASAALADGRVDPAEAAPLLGMIRKMREHQDAHLIPSLTALARRA